MNSSSSTGSRRSWDPVEYIGAPLIPSPAANRTSASVRQRNGSAGGNSSRPFKGYGKLMRKRPTASVQPPMQPTNVQTRAPSPTSSLSSRILQISLSDVDSDFENCPPSPVESFEDRIRRKMAEEQRSREAEQSRISEDTFNSHPVQTEKLLFGSSTISTSFHSCCSDPLESTRLVHAPSGKFNASSLSAINETNEVHNVSVSSDSTLNESPTNRYCEVFPIAEGLSPNYSRMKPVKPPRRGFFVSEGSKSRRNVSRSDENPKESAYQVAISRSLVPSKPRRRTPPVDPETLAKTSGKSPPEVVNRESAEASSKSRRKTPPPAVDGVPANPGRKNPAGANARSENTSKPRRKTPEVIPEGDERASISSRRKTPPEVRNSNSEENGSKARRKTPAGLVSSKSDANLSKPRQKTPEVIPESDESSSISPKPRRKTPPEVVNENCPKSRRKTPAGLATSKSDGNLLTNLRKTPEVILESDSSSSVSSKSLNPVVPPSDESSSSVVPGSPVPVTPSAARTLEKLLSNRKYRKSVVIPETSSSESEEEPPKNLVNEEPEVIFLDSDDEGDSVQNVASSSRLLRGVESVKKDAGSNRVNRWVLENSGNFRRTSSSSTLATFREFVENEDSRTTISTDVPEERVEEKEEKKKTTKSNRRKSMQCGERDSTESDVPTTVYDSTDDEEADRRLRELFEETRREKAQTERRSRTERKDEGLDNFIVPDEVCLSSSDEEEEEQREERVTPEQSSNVFRDSIPEDAVIFDQEWRKPLERPASPPSESYRTPAPKKKAPKSAVTAKQPKSSVRQPRVPVSVAKANIKAEIGLASLDDLRDARIFLGALDENAESYGNSVLEMADKCKMLFKVVREELTKLLYQTFNKHCFEDKLPRDMEITWSARMVKTAGFCVYKLQRFHPGPDGFVKPSVRFARIELSEKVLDSADRLRDTLVHEMCHAMSWIVSECNGGHGPVWKRWTKRVGIIFPNIPAITTRHTYEIKTKYTYRCVECGYSLGRHSKSLNTDRKRCGYCYGRFELIVNGRPKAPSEVATSSTKSVPSSAAKRTPNPFALFVQEHFKTLKQTEGAGKSHAEIMGILSKRFAALKMLQENK